MEQNTTGAVEARQGWREDGRVDVDAVRAGTHDVNDAPAVFESLCDEVEQLRGQAATAADLHELLRAVLDSIDLPRAAAHIDWERARREVLEKRARDIRIGLNGFLNGPAPFETTLDWVRQSVEDYPVDYQVEGGDL